MLQNITKLIIEGIQIATSIFTFIKDIGVVCWDDIVNWFKNNIQNIDDNKNIIAFTLNEGIKDGKYNIVQGLFNKETNKILEGRRIIAKDVDIKIKNNICSGEVLTIFN